MDYEKKYNEALERARAYFENENYTEMADVFPKLAESDDERITRAINNMLPFIPDDAYANNGVTKEQVLAWLKKRKDISKQIDAEVNRRVCDMIREAREKWDSKVDDAIARMDSDKSVEHWQYVGEVDLEKEKEPNILKPHKGDDSNPYDMTVSEAQEYAIKRGFGIPINDGEVYVDERHMTQTIGNILRWADEHPKEQKPNIELIQRSWYTEGYYDREFNHEPKWIIKTGEGGPRYEENPKYGQHIEEKSAEWVLPEDFEEAVYKVANFISPFDNQEELRKTSHRFAEQLLSLAKKELDKRVLYKQKRLAMKYIDAERLKECLDAKYKEFTEKAKKDCPLQYQYMADGLDVAEQFIDSLQQEQPDNEDVDRVAQELYEHLYELKRRNNVPTNLYDKQEIIELWKAGIEYGRSHPKQEQPEVECEDLEEAAKHYSEHTRFHWPNQVKPSYDAFKAGAEWQKKSEKRK